MRNRRDRWIRMPATPLWLPAWTIPTDSFPSQPGVTLSRRHVAAGKVYCGQQPSTGIGRVAGSAWDAAHFDGRVRPSAARRIVLDGGLAMPGRRLRWYRQLPISRRGRAVGELLSRRSCGRRGRAFPPLALSPAGGLARCARLERNARDWGRGRVGGQALPGSHERR
jgi:hypothetical protein